MQSQVTIYASVYTSLDMLPTEAQQLRYLKAVLAYAFDGLEPDFSDDPILNFGFAQVKPNLDSSRRKAQAARENGAKGGRPKKEKTQEKPNQKPNEKPGLPKDETRKPSDFFEKEKEREGYYPNSNNPSLSADPCAAVADRTAPQSQLRCPKCNDPVIDDGTGGWYCQRCRKTTKVAVPSLPNGTPPPANVLAMVEGMR